MDAFTRNGDGNRACAPEGLSEQSPSYILLRLQVGAVVFQAMHPRSQAAGLSQMRMRVTSSSIWNQIETTPGSIARFQKAESRLVDIRFLKV